MTAGKENPDTPEGIEPSADAQVDKVRNLLRQVVDPEVGINIVDLGLVYRIEFSSDNDVRIEMTMTSPACPMGEVIIDDAYHVLGAGMPDCEPEIVLVWEPPWDPSMMSERSKLRLGWSEE